MLQEDIGYVVMDDGSLGDGVDNVQKTATKRLGRGSAQTWFDALLSALENILLLRPQAEALYPSENGTYVPIQAEDATWPLLNGASPSGFKWQHVQGKMKCVCR